MDFLEVRGHSREGVPTRWSSCVFTGKVWGLRANRWWRDRKQPMRRWPRESAFKQDWRTIYQLRSELWFTAEGPEQMLERGKVENLRLACASLDGVVVEAGGVFSFWRQVGRVSRSRGFQVGRMLQQGCVIPAVGGGLCQLSNSLYGAALRCGCEIVERHAHSIRMEHAPVHDATVAWNYVDLRFRVRQRTKIVAKVGVEELVVGFAAEAESVGMFSLVELPPEKENRPQANPLSCLTCNEVGCFRHANDHVSEREQ